LHRVELAFEFSAETGWTAGAGRAIAAVSCKGCLNSESLATIGNCSGVIQTARQYCCFDPDAWLKMSTAARAYQPRQPRDIVASLVKVPIAVDRLV
jgi:hypothetical protein